MMPSEGFAAHAGRLSPSELSFLRSFAAGMPDGAVLLSLAPSCARGVAALAEGLALGGGTGVMLHVVDAGDPEALSRELAACGLDSVVRLETSSSTGETTAAIQHRFPHGSLHSLVVDRFDPDLSPAWLSRLKPGGVVVRRNRISHGFTLQLVPSADGHDVQMEACRRKREIPAVPKSHVVTEGASKRAGTIDHLFESIEWTSLDPACFRSGNLVMGMAAGYGERRLAPFVLSLRSRIPGAEVMIFAMDLEPEAIRFLEGQGCRVVRAVPRPVFRHVSVNCLRYFAHREFLERHGASFEAVFLSDVGDVVFQGDIFEHMTPGALTVFAESSILGEELWNSGWVRNLFGQEALERLSGSRAVCSGTILGGTRSIVEHLRLMTDRLMPLPVALDERSTPGESMFGVDQGVHNYLLRQGIAPAFREMGIGEGAVFHHGGGYTFLPDGRAATPEGLPFAVVHQYNRDPVLRRSLLARIPGLQAN